MQREVEERKRRSTTIQVILIQPIVPSSSLFRFSFIHIDVNKHWQKPWKELCACVTRESRQKTTSFETHCSRFWSLSKAKAEHTNGQLSDSLVDRIEEFYTKDFISWQAPGKRDFVTTKDNGIKVNHQKRHLLYNLREVYELFLQENPGKQMKSLSNL